MIEVCLERIFTIASRYSVLSVAEFSVRSKTGRNANAYHTVVLNWDEIYCIYIHARVLCSFCKHLNLRFIMFNPSSQ